MSFLVVGLNHRTAPVTLLERVWVPENDQPAFLSAVIGGEHVAEAVVLSTCNRVEVYAAVSTFHGALTEIGQVLADRAGVPLTELADHLYVHYGDEAVRHLFTVASGLDSMVVGEVQILGQVREAYLLADTHRGASRLLHEVMQHALRVGKRVHTDTGIDRTGQSVVSAALALAAERFGVLERHPGLVVGAGSMGALAVATLHQLGIGPLTVINRTLSGAQRIASGQVEGRTGSLEELPAALAEADVVLTVTGSPTPVITRSAVQAALGSRNGRPLLVIDLAVPRDTESGIADLPGVTLIDFEVLAGALTDIPTGAEIDAARAILDEEVEGFCATRRATEVAPTVVALRARADQVVATELARLEAHLPTMDSVIRVELERTVRRVVSTLLHLPTVRMKELASAPGGDRYAAAVRELFLLDTSHAPAAAAVAADLLVTEFASEEEER